MAGMLSEYWSASVELGRHVEQQAARCQLPGIEGGGVQDRLESRARLPGAIARRIVFRRELPAGHAVAVVAGAAGIGENVTGPVIERDHRPVVQILAAKGADP
jgi:hypothetical protein